MKTKIGQTIPGESGKHYRVEELISSGTGQGDIYRVADEGGKEYALKLFHDGEEGALLRQIRILMERGEACPAYVHPLDILRTEGRIGYVMEYLSPDRYHSGNVLCNGVETEEGKREELPFYLKLSVLHNLCEAMAVLYHANLAMMDLKFDNLKVDLQDGSVKILDTDTIVYSEDGNAMITGTIGFMPPLTMKGEEQPGKYNDAFALAVILFMTLLGSHPLMGMGELQPHTCDTETYLFAEHPVYVLHPTDDSNRPTPDAYRTEEKMGKYPEFFRRAMERSFTDGLYDKEKRITPTAWCGILTRLYEESYTCAFCGEEHFFSETDAYICDYCQNPLRKPLWILGDKGVPLFFGKEIKDSDLWQGVSRPKTVFTVGKTPYQGKHGLRLEEGAVMLHFPNGETVEFPKGKTVPLFLNGVYTYQNQTFMIKEM